VPFVLEAAVAVPRRIARGRILRAELDDLVAGALGGRGDRDAERAEAEHCAEKQHEAATTAAGQEPADGCGTVRHRGSARPRYLGVRIRTTVEA
jgi:hypothetical protein